MFIARAALQNNIASAVMCNISPLRAFIMFCLLFAAINLPPVQAYFWGGFLGNCFCWLLLYSNWFVIIMIPNQPQRGEMFIERTALKCIFKPWKGDIIKAISYTISPLWAFIMFCLLFAAINLPPVQAYFWGGFLGNCFCWLLLYSNWFVIIMIPNQPQRGEMFIERTALKCIFKPWKGDIIKAISYTISPLRGFIMLCLLFVATNLSPFQDFLLCGFWGNYFA